MSAVEQVLTALAAARRAIEQAEAALISGGVICEHGRSMAWPPRPEDIDLSDGSWITPQQAVPIAQVGIDTIYEWLGGPSHGAVGVKIGGRWWVHRARLMSFD